MSGWQNDDDFAVEQAEADDLAYKAASEAYEIEEDQRRELLKLSYPQYLQTPHWDHMRRRALLRAGHQCQRCEARGVRLDVHHLTYERLGRESEEDLVVLCARCHAFAHDHEDCCPRCGRASPDVYLSWMNNTGRCYRCGWRDAP